jgi:acetolactate synthase-1/2/3 large subunit
MSDIRVADYIFRTLADQGIRHVFLVTGGGAMHLNDAIGKEKRLEYVCCHHEQACAIAAEGYSRASGKLCAVNITTGPGGTNALTGVLGQWLDSIPAVYISGQVRYDTTVPSTGLPLRQLGDQEADIISVVRPLTKYAFSVTDPKTIRYHLEKALFVATSDRPGPVWLDIPMNVQASILDDSTLEAFTPAERPQLTGEELTDAVRRVLERIREAECPVLLAGSGVRLSGAADEGIFDELIEHLGIPVQAAWNAIDLVPTDHPLYAGRPSTLGQRAANFIFQNSDVMLSVGCRMNLRQIGFTYAAVAREAYKISVDIDSVELEKETYQPDFPIPADAKLFLKEMLRQVKENPIPPKTNWLGWCRERVKRYPPVTDAMKEQKGETINPYFFSETLGQSLRDRDIVVSSNGSACVIPIQAMPIRKGQRHIVNSGCAAMGYGLPSAIGASVSDPTRRVICLEGDGSIMMNLQELQTAAHHKLNLKVFVFNNSGYLSIKTTQKNFFAGNFVGEGPRSGVSFPDFVKLGESFGLKAHRLESHSGLAEAIQNILDAPGPAIIDVRVDPEQLFEPRVSSQRLPNGKMVSKPLEDMYPFLERDEFQSNMLIEPWES